MLRFTVFNAKTDGAVGPGGDGGGENGCCGRKSFRTKKLNGRKMFKYCVPTSANQVAPSDAREQPLPPQTRMVSSIKPATQYNVHIISVHATCLFSIIRQENGFLYSARPAVVLPIRFIYISTGDRRRRVSFSNVTRCPLCVYVLGTLLHFTSVTSPFFWYLSQSVYLCTLSMIIISNIFFLVLRSRRLSSHSDR